MEVVKMRFICDTNELNTALSIVSRALAVRSTKPILEGILFESCDEGLRLTCTDLALGIETLLPATFSEEGRAVLPGKLLCEIIRKLPGGPCDIAIGERMQATIRCASVPRSTALTRWNTRSCRRSRASASSSPKTRSRI